MLGRMVWLRWLMSYAVQYQRCSVETTSILMGKFRLPAKWFPKCMYIYADKVHLSPNPPASMCLSYVWNRHCYDLKKQANEKSYSIYTRNSTGGTDSGSKTGRVEVFKGLRKGRTSVLPAKASKSNSAITPVHVQICDLPTDSLSLLNKFTEAS